MKKRLLLVSVLLTFSLPLASFGYELSTHGALVREAYDRSTLQTPDWMTRLGVGNGSADLGNVYLDMSSDGTTITLRLNNPVEIGKKIGAPDFTQDKFNLTLKLTGADAAE